MELNSSNVNVPSSRADRLIQDEPITNNERGISAKKKKKKKIETAPISSRKRERERGARSIA